ncbi:MAG: hypothetical protein ABIF87_11850 [Pseudomonadota bacterium]
MAISKSKSSGLTNRWYAIGGVCVALLLFVTGIWFFLKHERSPATKEAAQPQVMQIPSQKIIDYNKIQSKGDEALTTMMEERKADYGLEKSLDMVVKSGESIKVGDRVVPMKKIMDQVRLKLHEIVESDLTGHDLDLSEAETFGVYVVRSGDNIWNVHFNLLKEYFKNKDVTLSPLADEPDPKGYSSGVGKILKFSENLVHIYNLKTQELDTDLSLLEPLQKVVVYNMGMIFELLDQIDYGQVALLEFDGETLWVPAEDVGRR